MALEKRLTRLENEVNRGSPKDFPDVRLMGLDELEEFERVLTRMLLRDRLKREPTEEEIAADIEIDREYFSSLSNQELHRMAAASRLNWKRLSCRK